MVAMVAISELTLSRVTTRPLKSPTAPPNRMPAAAPRNDAAGLVGDVHGDDAGEGERGADREIHLGGDQQHRHAGRDDQHQRALAQDRDDIFDGIELRRADRDRDAEQDQDAKQHDLAVAGQPAEAQCPLGAGRAMSLMTVCAGT